MSNDTTQPAINKNGLKISWSTIFQLVQWIVPFVGTLVILYFSSLFATHQQVADAVEPYAHIPARVEKLEEFKADQKRDQINTVATVNTVQQDIAGMKAALSALKEENNRNTERILNRLDSLK